MSCWGCVPVSVSVCSSPPSPPSLALPQISGLTSRPLIRLFLASPSRVTNRLGALQARPPTPADTARRAGRGGAGAGARALPVPSRPLWPAAGGGGARGAGTGVSTGSARPSRFPPLGTSPPAPARGAWVGTRPWTRRWGFTLPGSVFQLAPLDSWPLSGVGRELEECARDRGCVLRESSRTVSMPREAKQPPAQEDQILQLTTLTPHGFQGAESRLRNGGGRGGAEGWTPRESWGATSGKWRLPVP